MRFFYSVNSGMKGKHKGHPVFLIGNKSLQIKGLVQIPRLLTFTHWSRCLWQHPLPNPGCCLDMCHWPIFLPNIVSYVGILALVRGLFQCLHQKRSNIYLEYFCWLFAVLKDTAGSRAPPATPSPPIQSIEIHHTYSKYVFITNSKWSTDTVCVQQPISIKTTTWSCVISFMHPVKSLLVWQEASDVAWYHPVPPHASLIHWFMTHTEEHNVTA